jgi:seryl-tRNA synthetase
MGHVSFRGAYALFGDFARLERALMYYAFEKIIQHVRNYFFIIIYFLSIFSSIRVSKWFLFLI